MAVSVREQSQVTLRLAQGLSSTRHRSFRQLLTSFPSFQSATFFNSDLCEVTLPTSSKQNANDPTITDYLTLPYYLTYYRRDLTVRNEISRFLQKNTFGPTKDQLDALEERYRELRGLGYTPYNNTVEDMMPSWWNETFNDGIANEGNSTWTNSTATEANSTEAVAGNLTDVEGNGTATERRTTERYLQGNQTSSPSTSPTTSPSASPTSKPTLEPTASLVPSSLPSLSPSTSAPTEKVYDGPPMSHAEAMAALQLEWVTNQMDPSTFSSGQFTSLRRFWRERLNARKEETYRIGESGPHACEKHSRWRKFAFTAFDVQNSQHLRWGTQELGGLVQEQTGHRITVETVVYEGPPIPGYSPTEMPSASPVASVDGTPTLDLGSPTSSPRPSVSGMPSILPSHGPSNYPTLTSGPVRFCLANFGSNLFY